MTVKEAANLLLTVDSDVRAPSETTNRTIMHTSEDGRHIIATDSILLAPMLILETFS